jgi:hypothetical protein
VLFLVCASGALLRVEQRTLRGGAAVDRYDSASFDQIVFSLVSLLEQQNVR